MTDKQKIKLLLGHLITKRKGLNLHINMLRHLARTVSEENSSLTSEIDQKYVHDVWEQYVGLDKNVGVKNGN